ncbi:NADH-quinone oxidoreductase subunit NuoN [Bacillus sp. FJAT-47783]|uniref:NADH-quinone oxidoreductase subunit NuoN n=1 Tax=Bacillus sp. FJAT-47783 TaxID=2922712 RepID=UPI001FAD6619|nr:NADH-quinone oxidoreductase subunit NuoN [Bacillus sp. FJAT-47783]
MDLATFLSYEWEAMVPEFIILGVAVILSVLDLFLSKKDRRLLGWLGFIGIVGATISLVFLMKEETVTILQDTFVLDYFAKVFKLLLLIGASLVMLLAIGYNVKDDRFPYSEFYYLFLTALLGAMIMSSSGELITLFVGLELLSISSYILAGIKKREGKSNEAALKYVINGGIASSITLFGFSYIYGLSGTTNIGEISLLFSQNGTENVQYVLGLAFFVSFVGLCFKIASVPFHMWVPDVYEGAPTPVTAFLSVVSKTAGFILIIRLFISIFGNAPTNNGLSLLWNVKPYIAVVAALTMVIGNVIALRQQNVKRMLAYSSIAHAGYILVAFVSLSPYFYLDTIWFYLLSYIFMNIGAFAIIQGVGHHLSSFAGIYKSSPFLALAMTVFLLSLAGIPGTAGFIAKFHILLSALSTDPAHFALALIMIITTIVSYVYYFGVLVQIFFRPAQREQSFQLSKTVWAVIFICMIFTILLGIFPQIALDLLYVS